MSYVPPLTLIAIALVLTDIAAGATAQTAPLRGSEGRAMPHSVRDESIRATVYGYAASPESADRVIEIRPGRRFVNVTAGETVRFSVNGKSFAWTFGRSFVHRSFALREIAPPDLEVPSVEVYCVPDLYERSG
jgi:hypothetical protein